VSRTRDPAPELLDHPAQLPVGLELLERTFAAAPVGLLVVDVQRRALVTNSAFDRLCGGKIPPGLSGGFDRAFAGELARLPPLWIEGADGTRIAVEPVVFPVTSASGSPEHAAVLFEEVTEKLQARRRAQQLEDAALAAEQASIRVSQQSVSSLSGSVSVSEVAERVVEQAGALLGAHEGAVYLFKPGHRVLERVASLGPPGDWLPPSLT
jgi:hypothetical protein